MAYQTFPWQHGNSNSYAKLRALYLPPLHGKRVLDIGCNAGYFCAWAKFQNAAYVAGVDNRQDVIDTARTTFPEINFSCMSWNDLGQEQFDLVLCLSAIHYAEDQDALLHTLMQKVTPDGILVLELGIAEGTAPEFVEIKRAIDTRLFPTKAKLQQMLQPYTYKYIGPSVPQMGDPLPRYVYHIQHKKPYAVLLLDGHYCGKTITAKSIFNKNMQYISGDTVLHQINKGTIAASNALNSCAKNNTASPFLDIAQITHSICTANALPDLLECIIAMANKQDAVIDMYMPTEAHQQVIDTFTEAGFFCVVTSTNPLNVTPWHRQRTPHEQYEAFTTKLQEADGLDEHAYLAAYPDVANAVKQGHLPSGRFHYWQFGVREGRRFFAKKQ